MNDWRPIETAPQDGTEFLIACPPDDEVERWSFGVGFWCAGSPSVRFEPTDKPELWKRIITQQPRIETNGGWSKPTHWMPLPDPPRLAPENDKATEPQPHREDANA